MELLEGTSKVSKFEPEDYISKMPHNVVSNILDHLPLQDAVRTCILARNWRLKWTLLSQLVFDEKFYKYLLKTTTGGNNYGRIISRLFLHLKGVITKFVLYMEKPSCLELDDEDINHWCLFLSGKGIKDLAFCNVSQVHRLKLPTHLFSCLELKHLKLYNCIWHPPTSFHGFPNLLSLDLRYLHVESGNLGEFFTKFPTLEILNMDFVSPAGTLKLADIAKLTNLKILSFRLSMLEKTMVTSSSDIFQLMGFLPKLQELELNYFSGFKFTAVKKTFHATFPCLRTLKLSSIYLGAKMNLPCVYEMIIHFPNLQTLEIKGSAALTPSKRCLPEVDYNTMGLLQFRSVVFTNFKASKDELCLIKYLLGCSPFLKKVVIRLHPCKLLLEKLISRELLKLRRASTVSEIHLY